MITIRLDGEPVGKGRPRFRVAQSRAGQQFVAVYTPAKTRAYEQSLAKAGQAAMAGKKRLVGPLRATVTAYMTVPVSWSAVKRDRELAGVISPTGRPDLDNLAKMIDGLNTICWADDSQIVDLRVRKLYAEDPRFEVQAEEIAPQSLWEQQNDNDQDLFASQA